MPNRFFYHNSLDRSISNSRVSGYFLPLPCFKEIPVFNASSGDPDQTPRSVASDQGLHRLPMSLLWDARYKWVNEKKDIYCLDHLMGFKENDVLFMYLILFQK